MNLDYFNIRSLAIWNNWKYMINWFRLNCKAVGRIKGVKGKKNRILLLMRKKSFKENLR